MVKKKGRPLTQLRKKRLIERTEGRRQKEKNTVEEKEDE